ncbi:hypothetical protein Syn7502_02061 [Synechococcus sp. PCC 7502]|uniref:hypothetical protein n=1 Tax=Synechococcus sp. PCC 7502 TaxID=1173263 RepID=UPI00029FA7E1|nr:hypothetical protein [Synechococcus sp. PCC 7502]AFY74083.1 hypothetical protein Syn7502_02061 [Synechococcus sp. PCC 7502]
MSNDNLPKDSVSETVPKTGYTVNNDGLLNNYALEPEMYEEDGGALSESSDRVTVVDIFPSVLEAKNAVLEMGHKGLRADQISIVGKDYQESESCINWDKITADGGLATVLAELGISEDAILQFEGAIAAGNFLVIAIGSDREASQAQHVLENIGHCIQG